MSAADQILSGVQEYGKIRMTISEYLCAGLGIISVFVFLYFLFIRKYTYDPDVDKNNQFTKGKALGATGVFMFIMALCFFVNKNLKDNKLAQGISGTEGIFDIFKKPTGSRINIGF
jgi:hypothetical protein